MFPAPINPAGIEAQMPNGQNAGIPTCPMCGMPLPMPHNMGNAPQGMAGMPPMPPMMDQGGDSQLLAMLMGGAGEPPAMNY